MSTFKCLRCGYCCVVPPVTIIHPDHVDSKLIVDKTLDYIDKLCNKPPNTPCPHLRFDEQGIATCLVRDREWFNGTICHGFDLTPPILQWFPMELIEAEYECIIGKYVRKNFPPNWWKDWWNWIPPHVQGMTSI